MDIVLLVAVRRAVCCIPAPLARQRTVQRRAALTLTQAGSPVLGPWRRSSPPPAGGAACLAGPLTALCGGCCCFGGCASPDRFLERFTVTALEREAGGEGGPWAWRADELRKPASRARGGCSGRGRGAFFMPCCTYRDDAMDSALAPRPLVPALTPLPGATRSQSSFSPSSDCTAGHTRTQTKASDTPLWKVLGKRTGCLTPMP